MCFADDCTTTEPMVQTDYCKMDFDSCSCLRDPMHSIDMSFIHWLNSPDPENAPNYVKGSIDNIEHSSVSNNITVDDNNNLSSDLSTLANLVILDGLCEIDVQSEEIAETIENIREIKCKFDFEKDGGCGVVSDVDGAAFRKRAKSSRRRYSRRVVVSKIHSDSDYESLNDSNSDTSGKFESEELSCDGWRRESPLCPSSSPLRENRERSKSGRRSKNTPRSVTVKENSETASTSRDSVYCCAAEGCGKIYRRRSHLQAHSRRHTGERPFQCEWKGCQWKFSRSDELVRHHRSHSGEKPFVCQLCDKRFARSDHLKKHMRIHTRPCCDKSP